MVAGLRQYLGLPPSTFARTLTSVEETLDWLFYRGRADLSMASALMGFFPPGQLTGEAAIASAAFEEACKLVSATLRCGKVNSVEVLEALSLPTDTASIVLYKDFDEGKEVYGGEKVGKALAAWTAIRNKPIALTVDTHNLRRLQKDVPVIVHVFVDERGVEEVRSKNAYLTAMRSVGRDLEAAGLVTRGQIVFALTNGVKHPNWAEAFGLDATALPAVGIVDNTNGAMYGMPGVQGTLPTDDEAPELYAPAITEFATRFYSGLLAPFSIKE